jgi:hypothetical protein
MFAIEADDGDVSVLVDDHAGHVVAFAIAEAISGGVWSDEHVATLKCAFEDGEKSAGVEGAFEGEDAGGNG